MVLHEIANLGPSGLAGSIPALGVRLILQSVNSWYFLIIAVIVGIRPFYRYWIKE